MLKFLSGKRSVGLNNFFKNVRLGFKYLLFKLRGGKKKIKNIIPLSSKALKDVDKQVLEQKNLYQGRALDWEADYKTLFRRTMKKVETNPIELIKQQKMETIKDISKRGQKLSFKKKLIVYTRDLGTVLGKFLYFSICDGYWYLIFEKRKGELDFIKAPSLEDLIYGAEAISNQIKHGILITNFIFVDGELVRVPRRYLSYV